MTETETQLDLAGHKVGGERTAWLFPEEKEVNESIGKTSFDAKVEGIVQAMSKNDTPYFVVNVLINGKKFKLTEYAFRSENEFSLAEIKDKTLKLRLDGKHFYVDAIQESVA